MYSVARVNSEVFRLNRSTVDLHLQVLFENSVATRVICIVRIVRLMDTWMHCTSYSIIRILYSTLIAQLHAHEPPLFYFPPRRTGGNLVVTTEVIPAQYSITAAQN